jgi:hypothetical protein
MKRKSKVLTITHSNRKVKPKTPRCVRKGLDTFDRFTGEIISKATGTVRRVRKSVTALDRRINKFGDEVEKLYDAQSRAGL